ncbi:hypothetical protein BOH78_1075 [Pichia kudriavzevii]|uniref:Uncharacterized protein n=1 Tax=Pichia kudriavzevii TaxID=4909 RepID=A0A1V2LS89_PICKU|nr:hypothetical protein BOH78_1075 [Pichia kudriavzevii]
MVIGALLSLLRGGALGFVLFST